MENDPIATALGSLTLLQFFIFLMRGDQDGNRRVGVFPEREEILIGSARFSCVALVCGCARYAELSQRIQRREWIPATMIDDGLKFLRGRGAILLFQINLATQVLRPEFSGDFVFARWFE